MAEFLDKIDTKSVWNLRTNVECSVVLLVIKEYKRSLDVDPSTGEKDYLECVENGETNILTL